MSGLRLWFCIGWLAAMFGLAGSAAATETVVRCFPTGSIYAYRWKLLELALTRTAAPGETIRLEPYAEDVTQNRGILLLQGGAIDVVALGTNEERERKLRPIRIDILRGIVGFRLLVIRSVDEARIAGMEARSLRHQLLFGLNSQWADLPIMQANGFTVVTSTSYENLFGMLVSGRFDAFPRGLNEARRELEERRQTYPQLMVEKTKAIYFPFPIYFWVEKGNDALAERIERGLRLSLADGGFRNLFETYHAAEIDAIRREKRDVIRLESPILPAGTPPPDTSWWWPEGAASQ